MNNLTGTLGEGILRISYTDHSQLTGRDADDSHPMSAITGLESALDEKAAVSDIPTALSQLSQDSTHATVTNAEKAAWNAKSNFSGSYNALTDKPEIPSLDGYATESYVNTSLLDYYSKAYIDAVLDDYIGDIAGLVGGDA